jgi:hypothetical protein
MQNNVYIGDDAAERTLLQAAVKDCGDSSVFFKLSLGTIDNDVSFCCSTNTRIKQTTYWGGGGGSKLVPAAWRKQRALETQRSCCGQNPSTRSV